MNSKYLIAIAATIILMTFLFFKNKKENKKNFSKENTEISYVENKIVPALTAQSLPVSSDSNLRPSSAAVGETRQVSELVLKQFSLHLKSMAKCLGLAGAQAISEKTEPTIDNLGANLKAALGDIVVQMDDWTQIEILDQNSVRKRVRVDYDYPDGSNPSRRLSMYQINSYGMPEIMNLTADEANNPNEAYISSLTEGHKVITDEKGTRVYFQDGEELIYSLRNGQLQSVSINKADKSFNCFNLDEENSSCSCP